MACQREGLSLALPHGDHAAPKLKFSLKVGTVFEDSPIGLDKWLPAVWLLTNCKNGISSYDFHRDIGVTQKSAWFMLHRIRLAMESKSFIKLGGDNGPIEVDEAFVGPNPRKMHASNRAKRQQAHSARQRSSHGNAGPGCPAGSRPR